MRDVESDVYWKDERLNMITIQECVTEIEKGPYIQTLTAIAKIDGLLESEKEYINFQAGILDIDTSAYWENIPELADIEFSQVSETTKRIILRDALVVAHIDKDFSSAESSFINELAGMMQVPEQLVQKLENWLLEYWAILEEGRDLLAVDES